MIFIRTNDASKITIESGDFSFYNSNRKGNIVKKFNIKENELDFFYDTLETKMIPKKSVDVLKSHPVKLLLTSGENIITFQDLDCKVSFLTMGEEGKIIKKTFDELIPEEDILCYNEQDQDWYLDQIELISMAYIEDDEDEDDEFKDIELSKYIITSDNGGIIINNIFVI